VALIVNHNMPAMIAARNLGGIYGNLSKSIERLSSGLRINSAADDAAGLAVRELMRADIATTLQGIRNAGDALSMIQTADGALAVIDARLSRMKELAEQAATGTYTTVQREIINSEYQAMAAEIDRVANAANFNGVKLLDGSINAQNGGQGIRIHFGHGNNAAEDYYYVSTDDVRATSSNGLRVGGDANIDIWSTGGAPEIDSGYESCCGGGFSDPGAIVQTTANAAFMYGYNWDGNENTDAELLDGRYVAGRYGVTNMSLSALVAEINLGTQARVRVDITNDLTDATNQFTVVCFGNEAYFFGVKSLASAAINGSTKDVFKRFAGTAETLASAINVGSQNFWAMQNGTKVYVFARSAGTIGNSFAAEEIGNSTNDKDKISFFNFGTNMTNSAGASFSLGGEHWGTAQFYQSKPGNSLSFIIRGRDAGAENDIWIADSADTVLDQLKGLTTKRINNNLMRRTFTQLQNASDGDWDGAHIRTQEAGQLALDAINNAIVRKDVIRANLGSTANRLEATIDNLTIQAENLQASESRISDVDVATEMTEYTKNNILAQAAASMLAQANSLSSLALTLIRG
jgi:flagellin